MKRVLLLIFLFIAFFNITVFAGNIPEELLYEDGAKLFFAEVVSLDKNGDKTVIIHSPTKKIKGDVIIRKTEETYRPNLVGDFEPEMGKEYLFAYFDENNDTDIFEVTSTDTSVLKLKNTQGDMWERFEKYLNEGKYEEAEHERTEKMGLSGTLISHETPTVGYENCETLADVFMIAETDVEELSIVYSKDGEMSDCQINKEDFFDMAEKIPLTSNPSIKQTKNGVTIVAADNKGNKYSVWIDKNGRVANSQFEASSAVMTRYEMDENDYAKLCQFFPTEALQNKFGQKIPAVVMTLAAIVAAGIVFNKMKRRKRRKRL